MKELIPKFCLILGLTVAVPGAVQAITLAELFDGGSITAGDKLFDSWYLGSYDAGDDRNFNPGNIDVAPLNDGGLNPGPGLDFRVSNGELGVTGNGLYNFIDLQLGFRVSVLDPLLRIKDNALELYGFPVYTEDGQNELGFSIHEMIGTLPGLNDVAAHEAQVIVQNDVFVDEGLSFIDFSALNEIWVTKNINVWSMDTSDTALLTGFEQRFSQEVIPEPSTVVLMLLGLVGLVAVGKRKLK